MVLSQLLYYTLPSADGPDAISASLTETRPVACCWSDCGRQVRSNGGESNFNLTPVCSISGNSRSGGPSTRRALQDASPAGFQQRGSFNISGVVWRHGIRWLNRVKKFAARLGHKFRRLWHRLSAQECCCSVIPSVLTAKRKCPHYGECDIDAARAGKTSVTQQLTRRVYDNRAGSYLDGSERTPHQAHASGLQRGWSSESLEHFLSSLPELWRQGEVRPTHAPKKRARRGQRTRPDPFEGCSARY